MKTKNKTNVFRLALLGIFSAIIVLQTFIPFLGYIPIQPISPTILHITVIVIAVVMGPLEGGILGGVWGILCIIRAFTSPGNPMDMIVFTNPLVSLLPRIMVGIGAGYVYRLIRHFKVPDIVGFAIAGFIGSFINTILVLGAVYLLYREPYANFLGFSVNEMIPFIMGIVATSGVVESIAAAIIVPIIAKPLSMYKNRMK